MAADRIKFMLLDNLICNYEYYDHCLPCMAKTNLSQKSNKIFVLIANIVIDVDEMVTQCIVDWHATP